MAQDYALVQRRDGPCPSSEQVNEVGSGAESRGLPCAQIGIDSENGDVHTLIVPGAARPLRDALPTRDLVQQLSQVDT